jgi:hypothetical protein
MKIGFLRKLDRKGTQHNKYRHLIIYTERKDRTLDIRIAVPLFIV